MVIVSTQTDDEKAMTSKLFTIHLYLTVTWVTRVLKLGGKPSTRETTLVKRLVVVAIDERDAERKALAWFEAAAESEAMHLIFQVGACPATAVRLAPSDRHGPVFVLQNTSKLLHHDVMEIG